MLLRRGNQEYSGVFAGGMLPLSADVVLRRKSVKRCSLATLQVESIILQASLQRVIERDTAVRRRADPPSAGDRGAPCNALAPMGPRGRGVLHQRSATIATASIRNVSAVDTVSIAASPANRPPRNELCRSTAAPVHAVERQRARARPGRSRCGPRTMQVTSGVAEDHEKARNFAGLRSCVVPEVGLEPTRF